MKQSPTLIGILLLALAGSLQAAPLGTAFTYQGKLGVGTNAVTGLYDFQFSLWDAQSGGAQAGSTVPQNAAPVTNGLFNATLDFGPSVFNGSARWLQVSVRTNGAGGFSTLSPRQPLTPTPYALFAPKAGAADSAATAGTAATATTAGTATLANSVANNAVTAPGIQAGQVVKSLNSLTDQVLLSAGTNILLRTNGNSLAVSAGPWLPSNVTNTWFSGGRVGLGKAPAVGVLDVFDGTGSNQSGGSIHVGGMGANGDPKLIHFGDMQDLRGIGYVYLGEYGQDDTMELRAGRFYFNHGNVGIFKTNPVTALDVNGTVTATNFMGSGAGLTYLSPTNLNLLGDARLNDHDLYLRSGTDAFHGLGWYGAGKLFAGYNVNGPVLYGSANGALGTTGSGANMALFWTGAGSVGIGGIPQDARLDVQGNIRLNRNDLFLREVNDRNHGLGWYGAGKLFAGVNVDGPVLYGWSGGGLGTTGGGTNLALGWTTGGAVAIDPQGLNNGTLTPGLTFGPTSGEGIASKRTPGDNQYGLDFYTVYQPRMTIANNGSVGIGTPQPQSKLQVMGTIMADRLQVGINHSLAGVNSSIAGGAQNTNAADNAALGGGWKNQIGSGSAFSVVGGGRQNTIQSGVVSGMIGGGDYHRIGAGSHNATVAGGYANSIGTNAPVATIAGGQENQIVNSSFATIGGGASNEIASASHRSTIGGGAENHILTNSIYSSIGSGWRNYIHPYGVGTLIAGGGQNSIARYGYHTTIGGGWANYTQPNVQYSIIAGGTANAIWEDSVDTVISGGNNNQIYSGSTGATIAGGDGNIVFNGGNYGMIAGGQDNWATNRSFAAGSHARAVHAGSFVWADSQSPSFYSSNNNQVAFRCLGGVRFSSGSAGLNQGVAWTPGTASWSFTSDRNTKENFQPVDRQAVLEKVANLPLSEWNYIGYDQRHIGPMAQDFHTLFPLNESNTTLNDADLHGVALAAIQGLNQKLAQTLKAKDAEIETLRQRLDAIERLLQQAIK